ncbi:hypothetical protein [Gracilimonas sediminicola]|uniref:Uncharacterized protein n=1 Tax=Gracilimonas sediminicola TaxID=2952158 RepID=A0A9X2L0H0_9BACT|nr:hypothetical protein [Gracilimonas sediminicola]MCP9289984.1 hypothetical protein [Gracilimonas sediminicola]
MDNQIDTETLREIFGAKEKEKPDVNEKYELFPNRGDDGLVQRVGNPTYALQVKVDEVRVRAKTLPEKVRKETCDEYGWEVPEAEYNRLEYYQKMLPLCVMDDVDLKEDFSTMEADRLIRDFLMCTYA